MNTESRIDAVHNRRVLAHVLITWHYILFLGRDRKAMAASEIKHEVHLGPQGRVVIPAHLRKALDLKPGDRLVVRQDGDSIVLERRENLVKRLKARFAHIPDDISLTDELIAERQAEAAREVEG